MGFQSPVNLNPSPPKKLVRATAKKKKAATGTGGAGGGRKSSGKKVGVNKTLFGAAGDAGAGAVDVAEGDDGTEEDGGAGADTERDEEFEENTEEQQQQGAKAQPIDMEAAMEVVKKGPHEAYDILTTDDIITQVVGLKFIDETTKNDRHCCAHKWGTELTKFDGSQGKPWVCIKGLKCPVVHAPSWMCREFLLAWMCGQSHLNTRLDSLASCCPCAVHAIPIDFDLSKGPPKGDTKWLVVYARELLHEDMPGHAGAVNAWKKRKFKQKKSTQDRMGRQKEQKMIREENDLYWEQQALQMKMNIATRTVDVAKAERDGVKQVAEYDGQTAILKGGVKRIHGQAGTLGKQLLAGLTPTGNVLADTENIMGMMSEGCEAWSSAMAGGKAAKKKPKQEGGKKKKASKRT